MGQVAAGAQALSALTIVARGVQAAGGKDFEAAQRSDPRLAHIDLRFVELGGFLDLCSSRLDGSQRADALLFVYGCLARWHRSEPGLTQRLVDTLREADIVAVDAKPELTPADVESLDRAATLAQRVAQRVQNGDFRGDADVVADIEALWRLASPPQVEE